MKRLRGYFRLIILLPILLPANVFALSTPPSGVKIVELQTSGASNATSEEFVELYNPTNQTIDISTWQLQYLSAGGTTWQTKATLNGYIYPEGRLLLAANDYLVDEADVSFSPGFKMEAGHVRISHPDPDDETAKVVEDLVGWGTALQPEVSAASFAPAGSSLIRKVDQDGEYVDTDNNQADFDLSSLPTPESINSEPEVVETPPADEPPVDETPAEDPQDTPDDTTLPEDPVETPTEEDQSALLPIQITELLPNPAAPASDSTDEYIELYNPNDESFDLTDYKLQSGNAFSYSYTADGDEIPPHSYLVLYVSETGLILANTSGQVRFMSPSGTILSQTDPYEKADEGEAWSYINGTWQWTTEPTPATTNVLLAPVTPSGSAGAATTKTTVKKKKTTKKKKATKAKQPKKKTVKKPKAKKTKTGSVAGASSGGNIDGAAPGGSQIHKWVIAGIGVIALGYALYEYKDDIRNKIYELRRNRTISRTAGTPT